MMISALMRDLARILSQNGDRDVKCRGRSDIEFESGELLSFEGYALGHGLAMARETGLRSFFRTVSAPAHAAAGEFLCFGSLMSLPRSVEWLRPDAPRAFAGKTDTLWVSPAFVRQVRLIALKLPGDLLSEAGITRALDPADTDPQLIQEVSAAVTILVDCGVLSRHGARLRLVPR